MKAKLFFAAIVAVAGFTAPAVAADVAPGDVKFKENAVEQSLTGKAGDPKAGRKWFVGRRLGNCLACHANKEASDHQFHGDVGPSLDGVASRYSVAQLRGIIVNPKIALTDQTVMPAFYRNSGFTRVRKDHAGKTILTAQQVEDVVAYLATLK